MTDFICKVLPFSTRARRLSSRLGLVRSMLVVFLPYACNSVPDCFNIYYNIFFLIRASLNEPSFLNLFSIDSSICFLISWGNCK